jgi:DNA polymerase sigma
VLQLSVVIVNQVDSSLLIFLVDHFFFLSWQVIAKARVPIVKFVERKSEIAFDIRLNCVSHQIFLCF